MIFTHNKTDHYTVIINGLQKYSFSLDYQILEHLFFANIFGTKIRLKSMEKQCK